LQHGLGCRLYRQCFARTGGPQKEKVSDRSACLAQAGEIRLKRPYDLLNGFVLSDDALAEFDFQVFGLTSFFVGSSNVTRGIVSSFYLSRLVHPPCVVGPLLIEFKALSAATHVGTQAPNGPRTVEHSDCIG